VTETLTETAVALAAEWGLQLGEPYFPGGSCAWVVPATNAAGDELVLKVGRLHWEAEHESDGLRLWDGSGAVRCLAATTLEDTTGLLLERCVPGLQLKESVPEPEQDEIVAGLLRRLWEREPPADHPFRTLHHMCSEWATGLERHASRVDGGFDPGLVRAGVEILRELPGTARESVLLATDLHAGNVLSSKREPWLVIDPKPFVGDPAYDPVQHMLNCDERLASDPAGLAGRMAELLDLDPERVRLWLFARCAQESLTRVSMREPARRLAP
jgi:streptomycin 6-kinase